MPSFRYNESNKNCYTGHPGQVSQVPGGGSQYQANIGTGYGMVTAPTHRSLAESSASGVSQVLQIQILVRFSSYSISYMRRHWISDSKTLIVQG